MPNGNQPPEDERITRTVNAIKELVQLFKMERIVYLGITFVSVSILIVTAISLIIRSNTQDNTIELIALFGSSGAIAYSTGRLLHMWSEAMNLMKSVINGN